MWKDVRTIPFNEMVKSYISDTKCDNETTAKEVCLQMRGWRKQDDDAFIFPQSSMDKPITLEDAIKIEYITYKWTQKK